MRKLLPVMNNPNLVRDEKTGAILNINKQDIAKEKRLLMQKQQEQTEIQELKSEVSDIKQLLGKLLSELSKNG